GADPLMLSGERRVARYPVVRVKTMAEIIETTQAGSVPGPKLQHHPRTRGSAIPVPASGIAQAIDAQALVGFAQPGDTMRRLARLHCALPLIACAPDGAVRNQLALSWGVQTHLVPMVQHTDDMFRQVDLTLTAAGTAELGDYVVIVAGSPPGRPGSTNTL